MVFPFIAAVVAGTLLGLRYKVFVLIPATGVAITIVALGGLAKANSFVEIVATMIAISTVLQLGYVLGNVIELTIVSRLRAVVQRYSESTPAGLSKSA